MAVLWGKYVCAVYREEGGVQEPPVTPIGRDELALKRHRFFSELLTAAQAAVEHRVRFDPLGPDVADDLDDEEGEDDCLFVCPLFLFDVNTTTKKLCIM